MSIIFLLKMIELSVLPNKNKTVCNKKISNNRFIYKMKQPIEMLTIVQDRK